MKRLLYTHALSIMVMLSILTAHVARADLMSLGVTGPQSGAAFSNIGVLNKETILTTMKNAEVLIEFESLEGDVLTATCTAMFEMGTDTSSATTGGQTLFVAFPLTANSDKVVKITDFELIIDGVPKSNMESHTLLLSSEPIDPSKTLI